MRLIWPISHITGLRWLSEDAKHVCPVELLIIRHNKHLAITLHISWTLRVSILQLEGKLKELLNVTFYIHDDLFWYSMIYKL